ncbi:MAG: hypothetical protein LBR13_01000 [Dysgonamonadaceae bacterium]|jgi:hypothetical protein|nr:hypothetical protein [Dysgonamonadaceae bacterium]
MKKISIILTIAVTILATTACDPIENRNELSGQTTMAKIDQLVSVTAEMRDGVRSNYLLLNADGMDALCSFDYGVGTYVGTKARVQVVTEGANTVIFTALNADGTKLTKEFTVDVQKCFDVAPEWGLFCGSGEKTWVWDDDAPVWGNGGYLANVAPGWWAVSVGDIDGQAPGEGAGASMIFSVKGSSLTKVKTDGTEIKGTFAFSFTEKDIIKDSSGEADWATGTLKTAGVTVLCGINPNASPKDVTTYNILKLDDGHLVLATAQPNTGAWGEAWFWRFRAK